MMNITVEQGEFKIAEKGYTLETLGAGPCILIGIYDKKLKTAYLFHEESATHSGKLSEFIGIVRNGSKPEDLIVKVRGGSEPKGSPHFSEVEQNRLIILESLTEFLREDQINVSWRQSNMWIDTETGKFKFR